MAARLHLVAVDLGFDVDALGGVGLEPRDVDLCEVGRTTTTARTVRGTRGNGQVQRVSTSLQSARDRGRATETAVHDEPGPVVAAAAAARAAATRGLL